MVVLNMLHLLVSVVTTVVKLQLMQYHNGGKITTNAVQVGLMSVSMLVIPTLTRSALNIKECIRVGIFLFPSLFITNMILYDSYLLIRSVD